MISLNALDADAFKLLYLWIHQANGASSTLAELMALSQASLHITRKALRALAAAEFVRFSGLADHAVCELLLPAFSVFVQPTGSAEKIFSQDLLPKKIFSREEEDSLINLKSLESSSSESVKKFFQVVPPDLEARLLALKDDALLNSARIRDELASLPQCTPAFIRAHACHFYHVEGREVHEAGMLRRRMQDAWPEPELCATCGGGANKYLTGPLAKFVEH